jgi:hypothetical protein
VKVFNEDSRKVVEKAMRYRKDFMQKNNGKIYVRSQNFQVSDYVLVAEHRQSSLPKLHAKWKGPCRIASLEFVCLFAVEILLMMELKPALASRF